jgi:hypothetical protein
MGLDSQGFTTPMIFYGMVLQGSLGKNSNRLMVWQFQRIQVDLERI